MARQSNVDVKDRREAVLSLLRREEPAAASRCHGGYGQTASQFQVLDFLFTDTGEAVGRRTRDHIKYLNRRKIP